VSFLDEVKAAQRTPEQAVTDSINRETIRMIDLTKEAIFSAAIKGNNKHYVAIHKLYYIPASTKIDISAPVGRNVKNWFESEGFVVEEVHNVSDHFSFWVIW